MRSLRTEQQTCFHCAMKCPVEFFCLAIQNLFCYFSGNGKMAVAVNSQNGLYIRLNRALSLPVKYWPVIQTIVQKETVKGLVQVSFHYHLCRH